MPLLLLRRPSGRHEEARAAPRRRTGSGMRRAVLMRRSIAPSDTDERTIALR
jgi:hypothetical protein